MKPRILLYVLIISVMPITFVSDTNTQVPALPDMPHKFKVCVYVYPKDDTQLDERLENFIRRELRLLGNVTLVKSDSDWDYLLAYCILEHRFKSDNTKTGGLSIARSILIGFTLDPDKKVPQGYGYLVGLNASRWTADALHQYAIQDVGHLHKEFF